jgi:hypothetical protein
MTFQQVNCEPCRANKLKCDRNRPCVRMLNQPNTSFRLMISFDQSSCNLRGALPKLDLSTSNEEHLKGLAINAIGTSNCLRLAVASEYSVSTVLFLYLLFSYSKDLY